MATRATLEHFPNQPAYTEDENAQQGSEHDKPEEGLPKILPSHTFTCITRGQSCMSSPEPEMPTVRYTAKELFARIDQKLDVIAAQLISKADHDELMALEIRVSALEASASEQKGFDRAKVAIVGLLLTIVGLLVPIVVNYL